LPDTFLSDARAYMHQVTGFDVKVILKPMQHVTLADILPEQHTAPAAASDDEEINAYDWFDDAPGCSDISVPQPKQQGHRMVVPAAGEYPTREWTCDKGYLKSDYICERAEQYDAVAVVSGMGTGKSEVMIAMIKQCVATGKSVVVRCQRKSDVQSMTQRLRDNHGLDFYMYSELPKGTIDMHDYPLLVMEWESSHRIEGAVHLTLMDEMRSMCAAMTSRTNGENMIANMDRLYHDVCRPGSQLLALCADMTVDDCAMDLIRRLMQRRIQWQIDCVDERRADAKAVVYRCAERLKLPGIDAETARQRLGVTKDEVQLRLTEAEREVVEHTANLIELMDRRADPMSRILFIQNDQAKICRNVRYVNFVRCLLQLQIDLEAGRKLLVSCGSNRTARMMHSFLSKCCSEIRLCTP
jgi:Origin of replication binding protein